MQTRQKQFLVNLFSLWDLNIYGSLRRYLIFRVRETTVSMALIVTFMTSFVSVTSFTIRTVSTVFPPYANDRFLEF